MTERDTPVHFTKIFESDAEIEDYYLNFPQVCPQTFQNHYDYYKTYFIDVAERISRDKMLRAMGRSPCGLFFGDNMDELVLFRLRWG